MLSVKQLADEIGISKQAVFKRINNEPLKSTLADINGITTSERRKVFLSEEAAELVKQSVLEKSKKPAREPSYVPQVYEHTPQPETINLLKNQLSIKDQQIAAMQQHINQLTDALIHNQNTLTAKILELFNFVTRLLPSKQVDKFDKVDKKQLPPTKPKPEPPKIPPKPELKPAVINTFEDTFDFPLKKF